MSSTASAQSRDYVWWEGEHPTRHTFPASSAFEPEDSAERDVLSGGDWLQTDRAAGARVSYRVRVTTPGVHQLWVRKFWKHGPFRWRFGRDAWRTCGREITLADSVTLRTHVVANWVYLGEVDLPAGDAVLWVEMLPDAGPAAFDCWLLTRSPFVPNGKLRPGQVTGRSNPGYVPFEVGADDFAPTDLDLRRINHDRAGDQGFVIPQGSGFVYDQTGEEARFWGVNLGIEPPDDTSRAYLSRRLAKLGVNLARFHKPIWREHPSDIDEERLERTILGVESLADEGIYSVLSFYFPLWLRLHEDDRFEGYDAEKPPFALLFVDRTLQREHRAWMRALLTTPSPRTGRTLAQNPAVAAVEIQNEDSLLFWTFSPYDNVPASTTHKYEEAFGRWLVRRYGSIRGAFDAWGIQPGDVRGDDLSRARVGLYAAGFLTDQEWARQSRHPQRASDQLAFFLDLQSAFYRETARYLREDLGVRCSVIASNWTTADNAVLMPVEKLSNAVTGTMDRHAYFSGRHEGEGSSYSVRTGHVYEDRSIIGESIPAVARPEYGDAPHMISEYGYPFPNRARAESVFLAAGYGRASGLDAVVFFSIGTLDWERQLDKFSAFSPAVVGQFPAASLIFRQGLVREAPLVVTEYLSREDLLAFRGSRLARPADLDALRAVGPRANDPMDPSSLMEMAVLLGRARIVPGAEASRLVLADEFRRQRPRDGWITSINGELLVSPRERVAVIDTPRAQGVCGTLMGAGLIRTPLAVFDIDNAYGSCLVVPLDGRPLVESERILIQAISEETNYNWKTERDEDGGLRIESVGTMPVQFREIRGRVTLRLGTNRLRLTDLDPNGRVVRERSSRDGVVTLSPDVLYTVVEPIR
ncbi:alpha-amylase family protein [Mucisphaera calidilacus]|nr:hypothetical protein [Mucisphaera calidilacus]